MGHFGPDVDPKFDAFDLFVYKIWTLPKNSGSNQQTFHILVRGTLSSGVATGGNLPPQPPIGHPVRSMQIRGDFHVGKNGGMFKGFTYSHVLHAPTLRRTFFGLAITKKGAVEVVEGVTLVGPQ